MAALPDINENYLQAALVELLNTPSPTGYTHLAASLVADRLAAFADLEVAQTPKGVLVATWATAGTGPSRALTAHFDTLGAMVKEIKENGRLRLSALGSFAWNTVEGEGCTIFTGRGQAIRGALLLEMASGHIFGNAVGESERTEETMEVRLDLRTSNAQETRSFGVEVGDFVAFDPRVELSEGFIRARHLDNKASVACVLAAIHALQQAGLRPARSTVFHFSNYEEVGHGAAAGIPPGVVELVTLDMAVVGPGQTSDEFSATLCVKDKRGPYDRGLSQRLRELAQQHQIPYNVDIYPYYGSDGEAFWRAGGDVAVALIGPGVDASHNYERTHLDALVATARWILAYLLSPD